jgi:hypothetical protein
MRPGIGEVTSAQPGCVHREYCMTGIIPPEKFHASAGALLLQKAYRSRGRVPAKASARMRPKEVIDT